MKIRQGLITRNSLTRDRNEFSVTIVTGKDMPLFGIGVGHYAYDFQKMPGWLPQSVGLHFDNGK